MTVGLPRPPAASPSVITVIDLLDPADRRVPVFLVCVCRCQASACLLAL